MRIVASELERAGCNRARALMRLLRVQAAAAAAVVKVDQAAVSAGSASRLRCRSISTGYSNGSSQFRVCLNGNTRTCKRASMVRCFTWKPGVPAAVVDQVVQAQAPRATN